MIRFFMALMLFSASINATEINVQNQSCACNKKPVRCPRGPQGPQGPSGRNGVD